MGIGTSLFLLVLGAILAFAVHARVSGIDVNTLGVILMVVGAAGGVLSVLFWNSWGGSWGGGTRIYHRQRTVVGSPVVRTTTPVVGASYPVAAPVVGASYPVANGVPVVGQAVPVAGASYPVGGVPVAAAGVPVVGQAVPVVGQSVPVERTTIYEDRI